MLCRSQFVSAALSIARWLATGANQTAPDSRNFRGTDCDLYYGNAGILLFLLEAFYHTGEQSFLEASKARAEFLRRHLGLVQNFGLYDGVAGIAFSLLQLSRTDPDYEEIAHRSADRLKTESRGHRDGVEWNQYRDVVSGTAGIGLALVDLSQTLRRPDLLELAARAGDRLLHAGVQSADGCYWPRTATDSSHYPNFAHGTAGVGYFLARLFSLTKQLKYFRAASRAAHYLGSIACKEKKYQGLVPHNEDDGRDLFYLGWCHGPAGTSRLFFHLYRETGDERWWHAVNQSAGTIMDSGVPEQTSPGYWNNVSRCCGAAGIAEWMLALYLQTAREDYRIFSERIGAYLLERASSDGLGLTWRQAENRKKPENLSAQIGLMQGAAGVALFLIHLDESFRQIEPFVRFPDSPW
jgi:lantibiotic modifying enzyme